MRRILVYGLSEQWGGIEAIIHSIICQLEDEIKFDILISGDRIDDRHKRHKDNVTIIPITAWGANIKQFRSELKGLFLNIQYDYVWINASLMCNRDIIAVTQKFSNAKIIAHSHGTFFEEPNKLKEKILLLLHIVNRPYFNRTVKYKLMCSVASGRWFYGTKAFNKGELHLIKNGIDIKRFEFNEDLRRKLRSQFGFSDEKVLLHAGRLTRVKNQKFLIGLMNKIAERRMNVKLLIAGDGELRGELENEIKALHLETSVRLLGARSDVDQLYQAADIFVLPSFHEGFPVTLTEAQAAGLPCIVSEHVSKETNISGAISFLPIESSYTKWIEVINHTNIMPFERVKIGNRIRQMRYDISDVALDFKKTINDPEWH